MELESLLETPIWSSLTTGHASLAIGAGVGKGLARRYPAEIGPLAGLREPSAEAYADLAAILGAGEVAVLFLEQVPALPEGWRLVGGGELVQMVCREVLQAPESAAEIVPLGSSDFDDMLALATRTKPGPFRSRTAELGGFLGIRVEGQLAGMAGLRLAPAGAREVSAVCVDPAFRGRGYAGALVRAVVRNIVAEGQLPFLTSYKANEGAIRVYREVGFTVRREFQLAVIKRGDGRW